jgi:hypothetical protein
MPVSDEPSRQVPLSMSGAARLDYPLLASSAVGCFAALLPAPKPPLLHFTRAIGSSMTSRSQGSHWLLYRSQFR